jgi:dCMP deaminase
LLGGRFISGHDFGNGIYREKEMTDWHHRFLSMAAHVGSWSKDPSTKVGAVIVRKDRTIVSVGYNGFPRGCRDLPELYADREKKYPRTVHAEVNAILTAREPLHGCSLYVSPLYPCPSCAGIIIQSGIFAVYAHMPSEPGHWAEAFETSKQMFKEAGVIVGSPYSTR